MKVFISWSGELSHKVALCLREWLPSVIQSLEPYVSSEDIDKGERWNQNVIKELEETSFGIICVTKDNYNAPWLLFEAGALSKAVEKSWVVPFLFNVKRSEIDRRSPLLQFQSVTYENNDIKKMLLVMNKACPGTVLSEQKVEKSFDVWYPQLEQSLNSLQAENEESDERFLDDKDASKKDDTLQVSPILEELLELARDNQRILRDLQDRNYDKRDSSTNQVFNIQITAPSTTDKNQEPLITISDDSLPSIPSPYIPPLHEINR